MIMKKLFTSGAIALAFLWTTAASANDSFTLDPEGYIRHWVMLAPIPLPGEEAGSQAIFRQQIRGEADFRPKAGDTVRAGGRELTWRNITASTNFFDFNATLGSIHDRAAGYMVTYIECETEKPDVIMAVGTNDEGRIYFNGVDIYLFSQPRTLTLDADKGKVTLKKGLNVIVFKIINEQNAWQGAMRLMDKSGAPLKDVKIKLAP